MVTRARKRSFRVYLKRPAPGGADAFIAAVHASRRLHGTWVTAPATRAAYRQYVERFGKPLRTATHAGFVAVRVEDDAPVGVLNLSEIVRGGFQSAYLGYYALVPHAGQGYMTEALALVLDVAYREIGLHRVEANVQPGNRSSVRLVERVGFTREGYSRRYVKVGGRWRDHLRFAMLAEDWPALRRKLVARLHEESR
jgi:ribosomal-protein-alanine N-acetyltransferase